MLSGRGRLSRSSYGKECKSRHGLKKVRVCLWKVECYGVGVRPMKWWRAGRSRNDREEIAMYGGK